MTTTSPEKKSQAQWYWNIGRDHGLPLLIYSLSSLIFTWPTAAHFTTRLVSLGGDDPRHNLWLLWHVREVLWGNQGLYQAESIYYPYGISLLTHGLGPITGFFALPFWPWGLEAAHNGAVLVGFGLTGYLMYLLARGLGFRWGVAMFAGMMLLLAPIHQVGLYGHMTKVFLGLIPLALLMVWRALDGQRQIWWAAAAGLAFLLLLLHHPQQFIFVAVVTPLFVITAYVQAAPAQRWLLVKRTVLLAFSILVIAGPLALAMYQAGQDPRIVASTRLESYAFRPDVLEFIVPPTHSRLWGSWSTDFLARFGILSNLETNVVFLSWVGLFLVGLAWLKQRRAVAVWVGVTVVTAVLALGPSLQLLGQDTFTAFDLPLIMPFAFVSELPGLGVIRTPGRFMMVGSVTFIVAASYGLAWLTNRFSQQSHLIIAVALALLLLENWPHAWSQETLRPIPDFYQQIAADPEQYGVLDLPIKPSPLYNHISYSAHYQMYQTIHGQGIATAYISRSYTEHPLFPCLIPDFGATSYILFVNGEPSKCYANILDDLNRANYRYIVWHKPQNHYPEYRPGSWGEEAAAHFINQTLGGQPPLLEDELVRVYHIPGVATEDLTLAMNLGDNWYPFQPEYGYRWAVSPAVIRLASPVTQPVVLEIMPGAIYAPETDGLLGDAGQLVLKMDNGFETTVSIRRDEVTAVPLTLPAGQRTLTLTLTAGNFRSSDYGTGGERQQLSFAIRSINLQTVE